MAKGGGKGLHHHSNSLVVIPGVGFRGFGVWGLGFRVLGFWVLGLAKAGLGFRVSCAKRIGKGSGVVNI